MLSPARSDATVSGRRAAGLPKPQHLVARDAARYEHDARAAVGVGPFGERHRRMEDMVDAVDHYLECAPNGGQF